MKRRITIAVLALAMVFTMSASAFADVTTIDSISAKADWTKVDLSAFVVGAEIPDRIVNLSGITDGILQSLGSDKYIVVRQGWVRKSGNVWYSKGARYPNFLEGVVYGIGLTIRPTDRKAYEFSSDIGDHITIQGAEVEVTGFDADSLGIVFEIGTTEDVQRLLTAITTTNGANLAETANTTTNGANTADSSNIALYSFTALLALAGIGIVGYKKRSN